MAAPTTLEQALVILNATNESLGMAISGEPITADNLANIGTLRPELIDSVLSTMNIVLTQRFYRPLFDSAKNAFRVFLRDLQENGWGALEVFQQFIAGRVPMWSNAYTDAQRADDLVSYQADSIVKQYHTAPIETQFKTTIDRKDYKKVFTAYGLPQYIDNKIANMSASAEYWLMNQIIATIKSMVDAGDCVFNVGHNLNTDTGCRTLIEAIRTTAKGMTLPSTAYNKLGVINLADSKEDIYLLTTPEKYERLCNRIFTGAYNLSQTDLPFVPIYAPNGTDLGSDPVTDEEVLFILLDRKALFIGIDFWTATSELVKNTLWLQNFLSIRGIASYNRFFSCVAFTGNIGEWEEGNLLINANVAANYSFKINNVATTVDEIHSINSGDTISIDSEAIFIGGSITIVTTYLSGDIAITTIPYTATLPAEYIVPAKVMSVAITANMVTA